MNCPFTMRPMACIADVFAFCKAGNRMDESSLLFPDKGQPFLLHLTGWWLAGDILTMTFL